MLVFALILEESTLLWQSSFQTNVLSFLMTQTNFYLDMLQQSIEANSGAKYFEIHVQCFYNLPFP